MWMLALDTCFGKFSIALFKDAKEVAFFEGDKENQQAEFLIPEIENILNAQGIWYQDLEYLAAAVGPGSFTGLRIGLAAAKGICLATSVKPIAVSSLEAAAQKKGAWEVYLNANRGEAYYQKNAHVEPELVTYDGELDELPNARDVAKAALKKIPHSSPLLPLYVRKPDAKLPAVKDSKIKLSEIHKRCFPKGWSEEMFKTLEYILDQRGLVAWETVIDECEIKTICVLPEFRKQGIAEKLMKEMLDKVTAKKFFLEVSEKNTAAIGLYEKLGFKAFSKRKDYYGVGDNALMMVYERP